MLPIMLEIIFRHYYLMISTIENVLKTILCRQKQQTKETFTGYSTYNGFHSRLVPIL